MTKRKQKSLGRWGSDSSDDLAGGVWVINFGLRSPGTAKAVQLHPRKWKEWVEDNEWSITLLSNYQHSTRRGLNSLSLVAVIMKLTQKEPNLDIAAGRRRRTFVEILVKLFMTPKVKQAIIHEFKGICFHTKFPTHYMRRDQLPSEPFLLDPCWGAFMAMLIK